MKILYLITKSNFGGAQRYVLDLATEAKNKGFLPVVAAGVENKKNELPSILKARGIPFIEIQNLGRDVSIKRDLMSFFSIFKIIWKETPGVVHFNSSKMGLGLLAARIIRIFKNYPKRIIFTAHGWPFNEPRSYFQKKIIYLLSWLSVLLSDKTITVAHFDYEKGILMPMVSKKITYIPNGIAETDFISRETAREKILSLIKSPADNSLVSVTIAELNKNKGLSFLIEAAKKSELPIKFVIIGEGDDREILQKLIKEKKLNKKVFLAGKIIDAKNLLKGFDMFILPSIKEGLPYVILEAGQAALPAIATSVGGIPEIIDDMKSGILIRRGDSDELETAIAYIYENRESSAAFGNALKEKVEKDFNIGKMTEETFKLYKED